MKRWKQFVISFAIVVGLGAAVLPASGVSAVNVFDECANNADSAVCKAQGTDDLGNMVKMTINGVLVVLGMVAVIMIVVGGVRYTTSNGDAATVKSAKDTILYAVVGLIVAIMSFAIVNFVVGRF